MAGQSIAQTVAQLSLAMDTLDEVAQKLSATRERLGDVRQMYALIKGHGQSFTLRRILDELSKLDEQLDKDMAQTVITKDLSAAMLSYLRS